MQIDNPFPRMHTRLIINDKDTAVTVSRAFLEVPDDAEKVVVEAIVDHGRGKITPAGPKSIWTKEWGHLLPKDYDKKVSLREEEAAMEQRRKDEALRREQEAIRLKAAMKEEARKSNRGTPDIKVEDELDLGDKLEL